MRKLLKNQSSGFTLIEILVVIGIIAVLAAIVIIAINPARQFAQARNSQRTSNVNAILNAIGQYTADNKGDMSGLGLPGSDEEIRSASPGADICSDLVPTYLPAMLVDPGTDPDGGGSLGKGESIPSSACGSYSTGYEVSISSGRVTVSAPDAELSETIEVTR